MPGIVPDTFATDIVSDVSLGRVRGLRAIRVLAGQERYANLHFLAVAKVYEERPCLGPAQLPRATGVDLSMQSVSSVAEYMLGELFGWPL